VAAPEGEETFILPDKSGRQAKEQAMHDRCITKIAEGLRKIEAGCERKKHTVGEVERRIGRLLERHSHAAALFKITTYRTDDGRVALLWEKAGLGNEPRKILDELSQIQVVDVILPTRSGIELRRRCVTQPTKHQAILLQMLGLHLPNHLAVTEL